MTLDLSLARMGRSPEARALEVGHLVIVVATADWAAGTRCAPSARYGVATPFLGTRRPGRVARRGRHTRNTTILRSTSTR